MLRVRATDHARMVERSNGDVSVERGTCTACSQCTVGSCERNLGRGSCNRLIIVNHEMKYK